MKSLLYVLILLIPSTLLAQAPHDPPKKSGLTPYTLVLKTDVIGMLGRNVNLDLEKYLGKKTSLLFGVGSLDAHGDSYGLRRDFKVQGIGVKAGAKFYPLNHPGKERKIEGFALSPVVGYSYTHIKDWNDRNLHIQFPRDPVKSANIFGILSLSYQKVFLKRLTVEPSVGTRLEKYWQKRIGSDGEWGEWYDPDITSTGLGYYLILNLNVGYVF